MIAEPYICIKGQHQGVIEWTMSPHGMVTPSDRSESWKPYADFEREKLEKLRIKNPYYKAINSNWWMFSMGEYTASELIGYEESDCRNDSESNRLLARARFLKAVCEKEGVEFLPKEKCRCLLSWPHICKDGEALLTESIPCPCSCHEKPEQHKQCCVGMYSKCDKCLTDDLKGLYEAVKNAKPEEKCCEQTYSTFCDNCDSRGEYCSKECTCPCHKKPEKCCKGFKLDGVLFHECKEHRPYCAKDWPCCCTMDYYTRAEIDEKITKAKRCMWDEEREWRGALLDLLMEIITNTTQGLKYQGSKWIVEDLRRKFT